MQGPTLPQDTVCREGYAFLAHGVWDCWAGVSTVCGLWFRCGAVLGLTGSARLETSGCPVPSLALEELKLATAGE